tara:strand:+ start:2489 stop:2857 length:369 start_codon:yes stop_codon:yes gene_type:complete
MSPDWKQISKFMTEMHNALGGSIVDLQGLNATHKNQNLINTSKPNELMTLVGNKLKPKGIRKFMWEHRKSRRLLRPNAVIWSWFDSDENKTIVGFGASVKPQALDRSILSKEEIIFTPESGN